MYNKITKSRLNNFLSYRWLAIVATLVAAIVIWELLISTTTTRLAVGQYSASFCQMLDESAFSYDIRGVGSEQITAEKDFYGVVALRFSSDEGNAVITDGKAYEENGKQVSKAKEYIDMISSEKCSVYDMDGLYSDAKGYLESFLKTGETDCTDFDNLDKNKIRDAFILRKSNDNSFKAGEITVENEYERIAKLCLDLKDFKKILDYDDSLSEEESIFYLYRKYEQIKENESVPEKKVVYQELYNQETVKKYGLRIDKLPSVGAEKVPADYFRRTDNASAEGITLLTVDMQAYGDLRYETISFITTVVKTFSTIL